MKKITLIAALLGSVYFANAQVGIGTPDPAVSAELEIFSTTKGLLIPRVKLTDIKIYKPIIGEQVESLLVYNINEVKDATDDKIIALPKGFYYWDGAKWNRIVSKSELDKAIENLGDNITKIGADVTNLKNLINYIVPTNPGNVDSDGKPVVVESHSTIVYDPKTGEMSYVTYEGGKYVTKAINLTNMIRGIETNTFFIDFIDNNSKVTGYVYFNEATITKAIEDALKIDPKATEADIINGLNAKTPGAITIEVKGVVVNNIKEILESNPNITIQVDGKDKTFTTVEEYLQYITQFSEGNVIYTQIEDPNDANKKIWAFQYYDATTKEYKTINLNDLVKGAETKTFIRKIEEKGKANKFVYFSEQTIIDWLAADKANTVDNIPNDAPGAVTVDIMKELTTNIEQFFTEKTTVLKEGSTTEYHTVQELIENISKNVSGNVIYKEIEVDKDPSDPSQGKEKVWVFQYYDAATNEYKTINLNDLVKGAETKTTITRTESKADKSLEAYAKVNAPVDKDVKKGEIFYKYDNEAGQPDYINMTGDILLSIENNEKIKNAITNVLNAGGNVYYGDHDGDEKDTAVTDKTPHVFYHVVYNDKTNKYENKEIDLPLSMLTKVINKHKDVVKKALGDNITNAGDIVFTGNVYNGRYVYLAKGTTKAGREVAGTWVNSARTTGVELKNATAIHGVLSIKLMKGDIVVANSATDIVVSGTTIAFNIGTAGHYIVVPTGDYDVVVEYAGNEVK
ncbi:hypothetical protein [Myroides phaeus]|uniref:Uncharacterized protein n=1 Tax=Myroides phaeus TaxID=702745 RepID=A0A1G8DL98_9FLAO|nr:hypothetical protein [Myroides phaeus]SDH58474.1 hypothetical protein SAMN05421818_10781 [Myroides phaeus]